MKPVSQNKRIKAVIPVAGIGTKLRPHTYTQPKPLIPVAGKPILAHIIDRLVAEGISDFVLIIGYLGHKIRSFLEGRYPNLSIEFVYQEQRLGLGHAIWTAREAIKDSDEIIIALGDTIIDCDYKALMDNPNSVIGVSTVKNPGEFGIVEVNEEGFVTRADEKPTIPTSNLAIVGIYKIAQIKLLLKVLDELMQSAPVDEEYHLTEALGWMLVRGEKIATMKVNRWFDCGKKEVLLETNAILLAQNKNLSSGVHDFENSIIIPPVAIGEHCKIKNSIIGPDVTIGDNTSLTDTVVKNSIIGSYSKLQEIVLLNSIVGNDASVIGQNLSLNIGDNTEIEFD